MHIVDCIARQRAWHIVDCIARQRACMSINHSSLTHRVRQVSHPGSEIHFIKCVDQPAVETPAAKGQPFHINAQVIAGTVHQDVL